MQRSQRGVDNAALNWAIELGNELKQPVLTVFGLTADYPGAQRRHYRFLIEGLVDARKDLASRGVPLVVRMGTPDDVVLELINESRPSVVFTDENPVRIGQHWRSRLAGELTVPFYSIDADVVVPTSLFPKEEYAARTLRPKIHKVLSAYLRPIDNPRARNRWEAGDAPKGEDIEVEVLLKKLRVGGASDVQGYRGGSEEAKERLARFVKERLPEYAWKRNEPTPYCTSELSAHLHFGHINPITIALAVQGSAAPSECIDGYLEELIVRRELAINFVARNPDYDSLQGCPEWALKTLTKHAGDPRPFTYTFKQLDQGKTHDPLWNASQKEMVLTGRMHNYLRMYWAKKILEWSPDAETAFKVAVELNDTYEMDGRDPNGYAGIAWAIGGKHDRPWPERPIFGTVRFMSYESTRKKFDSEAYIARVRGLEQGEQAED
ncbi:deoxyribodipyrimidine photo-lyase [Singulisphaera sp. PoT]|uniref:deoxyribodipyrimidine photo-lyase n=1 Tax=Singulisphaera sp. PoT TaxID=3411797 RepID=UPI003BF5A923